MLSAGHSLGLVLLLTPAPPHTQRRHAGLDWLSTRQPNPSELSAIFSNAFACLDVWLVGTCPIVPLITCAMLVKHLEESGEEALAAVQYRRQYSRHDGRGAMVYTRGLHQAVDLESWLHAQENGPDVDAPNHDCIVLVPCRGKVVGEDVSRLIRLSAQWSIPGEVMRHLLNPHRDWGTEKMRDNTRWNSWTIHIPILLDVFVCQLAIGSLQVDGISQIRAVAFVPTSTISAFNEVASVFVAGESPLSTLQFRSAWLQVLFIWTGVRKWEQFTADFAGGVREQVSLSLACSNVTQVQAPLNISMLTITRPKLL